MPDDQQVPRADGPPGSSGDGDAHDATRGGPPVDPPAPGPEETAPLPAAVHKGEEPGREGSEPGPEETAPLPAAERPAAERKDEVPGPEETAPLPAAERKGEVPGPEETAPLPAAERKDTAPGPGDTAPLPAATEKAGPPHDADQTAALPPAAGTWYARAEVPRPGAPADHGYGAASPGDTAYQPRQGDWGPGGPDDGGRWWLPIVVAVVALLLLGVLGYGVWLIAEANREADPGPAATTLAPSRPRPTTTPPRTKPPVTATAPAGVAVPPVVGLPSDTARAALSAAGLASRLEFRTSDSAPPGTVIEADPPPGTLVPAGTKITLVIATAPPTPPAPSETPPTSPPATPNG